MKIARDITDLIGRTPLLALSRYAGNTAATVLAKCEFMNPYSVKDRPVLYMIRQAERAGVLPPGGMIVEATSGNTGIALASQAAVRGYQVVLVMSEISSLERRQMLAALGAELILTPKELGTKGARERAKEIAEERGAFYIGQHDNPANPLAHAETTAEELWRDTDGGIDIFVAAAGTTGTLTGVARALKPMKPSLRVVGVEPESAPFLARGVFHPHRMTGAAPGFRPGVYDEDLIDELVTVSEDDAFAACRELARTEGILSGVTSGAAALASRRLAEDPKNAGRTIVCVLSDPGERYLSMGFWEPGPGAT
jgi:cysteine synthase A